MKTWPKRILFFVLTNLLVVVTLSFLMNVLGVQPYLTSYGLNMSSLIIFCLIWGFGGAFISLLLSKFMAKMMMGVKIIDPNTHDPELRWLVSTVHRLANKAGISKMPEVGIYQGAEVNAFATGPSKNNSLVAVSTGLLQSMNKDQAEGVLGHEVAHVANGDMVTMALIQGVVNAFVMFLARIIAFAIAQSGRSSDDNRSFAPNPFLVFGLEIALSFLGMIVVAYFSRLREFRADAGGAQLAGREKMIGALERLANYKDSLAGHDNFSTMKISSKRSFMSLFSTHPDLELRIARLQGR